ncbi:exonuclease [Clavibacter phage CN1A]|uniref:Exonuclease n=1 Tax=Clavibacter phage CN1A TaxID=1406793 RepID=U5PX20_9CAUD|nr:exonuclease [Clavibacter phage CN1A]AGY47127.1 hypothetical protein CN1A_18 [Clavibacter phage CN1A]
MSAPELSTRNSNMGGRGYKHPHTGQLVPSVTTVLKAAATPAITQWAVDQTAAYAVANIDALLTRTEQQGYGFLRWYHSRDPLPLEEGMDLRNYHLGVLHDRADLGTAVHEWIEADLDFTRPFPEIRLEHNEPVAQMVERWEEFKAAHKIEVVMIEVTVWNAELGYAGTFDLLAYVDGVLTLIDFKTSRGVWDSHRQQLAALRGATTFLHKDSEGTWVEEIWDTSGMKFGLLHIRPDDINGNGDFVPSFIEMHHIAPSHLDIYFKQFVGMLDFRKGELEIKQLIKAEALEAANVAAWGA